MLMNCVVDVLVVATSGIWTRWCSRLAARSSICGEQWTRKEMCWISWCRADAYRECSQKIFRVALLKGLTYVPRVIRTSKLASSGAAKREILPGVEHRQHKRLGHPSRELAPTHAATREENAEIQISKTSTTVSLRLWSHRWAFPTTTTPFECSGISCYFTGPIPNLQ